MRRLALTAIALGIVVASLAACSSGEKAATAETTVTVHHAATPAPVYVDLGDSGPSVGDVRLFSYDATAADSQKVRVDVVMTTTGIVAGTADEYRDTRIIFSFANPADQLILEGVAVYPGANSVLKPATTTIRPLIGGSGAYAGATGWVDSTHNADGTWTHVFHIR
jgi:hypothetical protein